MGSMVSGSMSCDTHTHTHTHVIPLLSTPRGQARARVCVHVSHICVCLCMSVCVCVSQHTLSFLSSSAASCRDIMAHGRLYSLSTERWNAMVARMQGMMIGANLHVDVASTQHLKTGTCMKGSSVWGGGGGGARVCVVCSHANFSMPGPAQPALLVCCPVVLVCVCVCVCVCAVFTHTNFLMPRRPSMTIWKIYRPTITWFRICRQHVTHTSHGALRHTLYPGACSERHCGELGLGTTFVKLGHVLTCRHMCVCSAGVTHPHPQQTGALIVAPVHVDVVVPACTRAHTCPSPTQSENARTFHATTAWCILTAA